MKIKLGTQVTDKITGYSGVATARTEFMNGCVRVCVEAPVGEDGKLRDGEWFDEQRLGLKPKAKRPRAGPGVVPPGRDCPAQR